MNRYLSCAVTAIITTASCTTAGAYEQSTHRILTEAAVRRSVIYTDPSFMSKLGLAPLQSQGVPTFGDSPSLGVQPVPSGRPPSTVIDTISYGAVFEDDVSVAQDVARNEHRDIFTGIYVGVADFHFFDPQTTNGGVTIGRGLTIAGIERGDPSPDWILEQRGSFPYQYYSFQKAQNWFYSALTAPAAADRNRAFGMMFQSLGHVVHHIQDMAQPQHVRNEQHVHNSFIKVAEAEYELETARLVNAVIPYYVDTSPHYPPNAADRIPSLRRITDYWYSSVPGNYIGMAEFTAQNYVTLNTGFSSRVGVDSAGRQVTTLLANPRYPLPNGSNTQKSIVTRPVTVQNKVNGESFTRPVRYVLGDVYDGFINTTIPNQLLAREAYESYFLSRGVATPMFHGFDQEIWNDGYKILFPRSVAFAAGVINHFFRGRLALTRTTSVDSNWTITNAGTCRDPIDCTMSGTYTLYAENAQGIRSPLPGASYAMTLAAGASAGVSFPEPPAGTRALVVAFSGDVGAERNRVAGSVLPYTPPPVLPPCLGTFYETGFNSPNRIRGRECGFGSCKYKMDLGPRAGTVTVTWTVSDYLGFTTPTDAPGVAVAWSPNGWSDLVLFEVSGRGEPPRRGRTITRSLSYNPNNLKSPLHIDLLLYSSLYSSDLTVTCPR